jgi:hypothetical protein
MSVLVLWVITHFEFFVKYQLLSGISTSKFRASSLITVLSYLNLTLITRFV